MVRLLVLYGQPNDPAAFDKYYSGVHIPIARRMRGLKKWTVGKVTGTADGQPSPYYYLADLYMESREDFEKLLSSPEGQAAVADVPNYATGGATFLYTEMFKTAVHQSCNQPAIRLQIVGVFDKPIFHRRQFGGAVADDLAKLAIDLQLITGQTDARNSHRGVLEHRAHMNFIELECTLILLGDIVGYQQGFAVENFAADQIGKVGENL